MAINRSPLVVGVFENESQVKQALDSLNSAGFAKEQIGLATREGGATANTNLYNELSGFGLPDEQARYYHNEFENNRTVVSVRPDGRDQEVWQILQSAGAYNYDAQSSARSTNYQTTGTDYTQNTTNTAATYDQTAGTSHNQDVNRSAYNQADTTYDQTSNVDRSAYNQADTTYNQTANVDRSAYSQSGTAHDQTTDVDRTATGSDEYSLPIREERLDVNKERVQAGEARIHKDVVAEEQRVDVPVSREEVYIERRNVADGDVSTEPIGEGEAVRVPVSEEQVNVTKNTVQTGEVSIGKRTVEDQQQVSDTIRREEAHLEQEGNARVRTDDDNDTINRDRR